MAARLPPRAEALALAGVLLVAAALRLTGVDWDQGHHLHPDERFLTMVAGALEAPERWTDWFDTARSPLNPRNQGYSFFVYGTLPVFLVRGVAGVLDLTDYGHVHLVGRVLAALFDLATVLLTWGLGRALAGPRVGLAAAALMTLCVASIQHAHFFTVDAFAACFSAAALLAAVHVASGARLCAHVAFGVALAAAAACRINLVLLAPVYPCALAIAVLTGGASGRRAAAGAGLAFGAALLVFRVAHPYAFAGPGFLGVAPDAAFLANLAKVRGMVNGSVDFPPAYQWIGRARPLFALGNLAGTSLGVGWALAAVVGGFAWLRGRLGSGGECARDFGGRLLALWAFCFVLYHASQFVASQRYFLPALPVLAVAAGLLVTGARWQRTAFTLALAATALWALAFHGVYRAEHPRVAASRWMAEALPVGATLTREQWDDGLPLPVPGLEPERFAAVELTLYHREDSAKALELAAALDRADYVVLSSDRGSGTIPRAPWQYPLARRYYELLFGGALGFRLERSFTSFPRLGPLALPDTWSEEAFRVYDHPAVHVFAKTDAYDSARVRTLLEAVRLDTARPRTPAEGSAAYRAALPTSLHPERTRATPGLAGPAQSAPALGTGAAMGSAEALVRWLLAFAALACAGLPLARRLLPEHPGQAGLLALLLPWLVPGHGAWWLAWTGLAPFSGSAAPLLALGLGGAGAAFAWRDRRALSAWLRAYAGPVGAPAAAFLLVFVVFALLRAGNPTIYWGEKPMDFAILGALARARALPPADPWFAGETLNYFHFGHALVVAFARTSGVPLALAFNLALATAAGLAGAAAFAAGRALGRTRAAGVLAVFLVLFAGNLAAPLAWLQDPARPVDFHFFWAVSRVIEGTINEFPFWSFLFGDLHAHVLALPIELALIALGCAWLSGRTSPVVRVVLTGWLLGIVAATSTWSLPLAAGVQAAFLATAARARACSWPGAALRLAAVGAMAFVSTAPFWLDYTLSAGARVGLERFSRVAPGELATIFGLFAVALAPALLISARGGRSPRVALAAAGCVLGAAVLALALRGPGAALAAGFAALALAAWWRATAPGLLAAAGLAALAAGAVLAAEVFVASDRMNTVFKLHVGAWLLAAVAAAALIPSAWRALPAGWRRVYAGALVLLSAAAVSTSAAAAWGLLRDPKMASPVTLDGTRYLAQHDPDALAAYRWLNGEVVGVPVILEAAGPAYSESTRVAMHTGLPTPVGWEHHLVQQARNREAVQRRVAEVDRFFETADLAEAGRLLDRFRADFVFVGPGERTRYPQAGLAKLAGWERLEPVFEAGDVVVYATPGAPLAQKTWVDPVAASTTEAPQPALGAWREPRDLARARDGTLFVADFGHDRVQRVRFGKPDLSFGRRGGGPGELRDPCGVAVAPDGRVYVADTWNHRIQVFSRQGDALGSFGSGLYGPRGVAVGSGGRVWVTDTGNARVPAFSAEGEALGALEGGPAWRVPVGIAARGGELFVADAGRGEVLVYAESGAFLRGFAVPEWDTADFEAYLEVGADGTLWLTDPAGDRVLLYDRSGRALGVAEPRGTLDRPTGIALLDSHNAMVASAGNDALVMVRRPRAPGRPTAGSD